MLKFPIFIILASVAGVSAQSGRIGPTASPTQTATVAAASDRSVKELFDEANNYTKTKYTEYADKKTPYSDSLRERTQREQKQLAAKNAAIAAVRTGLTGEDHYYLGLLHWSAENLDGAAGSFRKYIGGESSSADKVQTARSLLIVILAKQNKRSDAESFLAEYLKADPKKLTERLRMSTELAKSYLAAGEFAAAAPHAEEAFKSAKVLLKDASSRARAIDELLDTGMLVFEAYSGNGDEKRSDAALDDMSAAAVEAESPSFYYYAVDKKITYMIETGRKPAALELYLATLAGVSKQFAAVTQQKDVISRLKKRETQYKLLREPAPELPVFDAWFPGKPRTMAELKGKVVLIDFWATWCGPCFEAFPVIKEWYADHARDGFEILGVTRYYGAQIGFDKNVPGELAMLREFRLEQALPYDILVARDQLLQMSYGAYALPTAVLIDRKGIIRYIGTGTSPTRLDEMQAMILKLLAEK